MTIDPPAQSPATQPSPRLSVMVNQIQPSPETIVLILAVVVGTGAGMGVVTFRYLIDLIHHLLFADVMGKIGSWGSWTLAMMPAIGGLIIGGMRWRWKDFGPSVSALISSVQSSQEISPVRPVTKMVAAAISLGSGASLGPEGPSVEIGANLGVLLGQALQVSQERQRLLLGAGAAAGLAAGFNAPIAGVFFALEVVLGTTFATSAASVVLLSAVVSSLIAQIGLGSQPAFDLPSYEVRSPLELPLYIGLGLCASLVAIAYTQLNRFSQRAFQGKVERLQMLAKIPREIQPILGATCVGLVALKLPQVLGIGYETIEAMLRDVQFSIGLLLVLLVSKLVLTALCLGSGLVGGVFAPAMFLGATLGTAYGQALPKLLPMFADNIAAPPAYAMVGMAAVLATSARAPLTAILLLFELTRDYRIVLPLMAAVGLSVWLMDRFKAKQDKKIKQEVKEPETAATPTPAEVITEVIAEPATPDQQTLLLQRLRVKDLMQSHFLSLPASLPIPEAGLALTRHQSHSALVMEGSALLGILTLQDINRALTRHSSSPEDIAALANQPIASICTAKILSASPDETVSEALDRMAARGLRQLPVLDPDNPDRVIGMIDHDQVLLAGSLALTQEYLAPYLAPSTV
ncbi:chloride channel protein [Alkalinema sp. FACHB-956]|uniref:chloride channel protein n=1 Tax=Alkalinema sp. FACHB-956 TaxID=2692768 RepID=UPI001687C9D3|nr:chloride channel protein [Alkalinema sp. FACHB-956]MBD2325486.1 chloride channel protein [Alkalinema sp. FACHB-956]